MFLTKIKKLIHFLLAVVSYWYYGRPARKLIVVGVTGTKGKSTTCRLIASALEAGGYKVGLLSTVEFQIGEKKWSNDKKMTMLGRGQIQKMLKEMVQAGCTYAVVETSSEGVLQYRHYGLNYDISVFTNLGTEHSERHGGFENLKRDKGKIFAGLKKRKNKILQGKTIPKIIVANLDDKNAQYYLSFAADEKWGFSLRSSNTELGINSNNKLQVTNYKPQGYAGSDFEVAGFNFHLAIPGEFNIYNALAAIAVGASQKVDFRAISEGLKNVLTVAGRMEFVEQGQNFKVVVDYAHEPMSLTSLFTTLREIVKPINGKVIGVIGSDGGGRDKAKRTTMGEIAGKMCDFVIISDVNPFDEDPKEIAATLAHGACSMGKKEGEDLFIIIDRKEGIKKALSLAEKNDIVAITAKGTEPCIVVADGKKIPWDDRKITSELLKNKIVL